MQVKVSKNSVTQRMTGYEYNSIYESGKYLKDSIQIILILIDVYFTWFLPIKFHAFLLLCTYHLEWEKDIAKWIIKNI